MWKTEHACKGMAKKETKIKLVAYTRKIGTKNREEFSILSKAHCQLRLSKTLFITNRLRKFVDGNKDSMVFGAFSCIFQKILIFCNYNI